MRPVGLLALDHDLALDLGARRGGGGDKWQLADGRAEEAEGTEVAAHGTSGGWTTGEQAAVGNGRARGGGGESRYFFTVQ